MSGRRDEFRRRVAILAYHKIGAPPPDGWDTWHFIPEPTFREQLRWIAGSGWTVVDLATFLAGLEMPERLPERSLLLTFDDGHRSMREVALPILRKAGYPAVCFVPTDHVGGDSSFDRPAEPREPMCDWDDLRELVRHGVEVQSHGTSHRWLSLLSPAEVEREIRESKRVLESRLDRPVSTLAFPFSDGGADPALTRAALRAAGYRSAFLCGGGPSWIEPPIGDPYRIDRLPVYRDTDLAAHLAGAYTSASKPLARSGPDAPMRGGT